jgi:hypothetical protein
VSLRRSQGARNAEIQYIPRFKLGLVSRGSAEKCEDGIVTFEFTLLTCDTFAGKARAD